MRSWKLQGVVGSLVCLGTVEPATGARLPANTGVWDPPSIEVTVEQGRSIDVPLSLRLDLAEPAVSVRTAKRLARVTPSPATDWQAGETRPLVLRLHVPGNLKVGRTIKLKVVARNQSGRGIRGVLPVLVHVAALRADQPPMSPGAVEVGDPAAPTAIATVEYTGDDRASAGRADLPGKPRRPRWHRAVGRDRAPAGRRIDTHSRRSSGGGVEQQPGRWHRRFGCRGRGGRRAPLRAAHEHQGTALIAATNRT